MKTLAFSLAFVASLGISAGATQISPVSHTFHRAVAARINTAGTCTTVPISANVQYDLSEPTPTATAAMVIAASGKYTKLQVDGTGCDIGIYIVQGTSNVTISDSAVHDSTRAGIVADTTSKTTLYGDNVYNIGDHTGSMYTPDGVQYGFGVDADSGTNVNISSVSISQYQKEGILMYNVAGGYVGYNMATGAGPINYIASNGFEIDASKLSQITDNRTELNQYTGPTYGGAGYILCGTSVNGHLIGPYFPVEEFAIDWENISLFNDLPYYFSKNANCS